MKFEELIKKIDDAYPDERIALYAQDRDGDHGDTFARAIVVELEETFEEDASDVDQLHTALGCMETVAREIGAVAARLNSLLIDAEQAAGVE